MVMEKGTRRGGVDNAPFIYLFTLKIFSGDFHVYCHVKLQKNPGIRGDFFPLKWFHYCNYRMGFDQKCVDFYWGCFH